MIGLVTSNELPELTGGEQLLLAELLKHTECIIVVWDDPQESWRKCSQLIVRTTWDYFGRIIEFLQWIDKVEAAGIRLYNPPNVLRWNSDKLYMRELAAKGVVIPETTWIPRGKLTAELLRKSVNGPCVLKPTVSAGGFNTFRVSPENIEEVAQSLADVSQNKMFMLQPFIAEVQDPGEYSLIFFGKDFSHAALKTPASGDFRVQTRYGGQQAAATVSDDIIGQARRALDAIPFDEPVLYARVDGVIRGDQFVLMELELIEPYLFLEFDNKAAAVLAASL